MRDMVSVIIPVYNGAEFLEACIRSVMEQTYGNLEIIVIDDGSKDASYAIAERLSAQDSRIRLARQENAGVSAARNRGLSMVTGRFVLLVDCDDLVPPGAVEALVRAAAEGADLVVGSHEEFRGNHKATLCLKEARTFTREAFFTDSVWTEQLLRLACSKLYKTEIILKNDIRFDETLPLMEDTLFTWRYCQFAEKYQVISDVVYRYRKGGMAGTARYYPERNRYLQAGLAVYAQLYGGSENIPQDFLRAKITDGLLVVAMHYLSHCSKREAETKIDETFAMFRQYLREDIIDREHHSPELADALITGDTKRLMKLLYRREFVKIVYKKIKKAYYAHFNKRI